MKKITLIFSILLTSSAFASPNNVTNPPRYFSNNSATPYYNNNSSNWNMPSMNWGNGNGYNNGSSWNIPSMNWGNGNGNGYNSGSNWNMPSMNWGNNGGGNNWNMPNMNWGNNNGYNNGSNWNMPNFNWNNQQRPWNYSSRGNYNNNQYAPGIQQRAPMMPTPPRFAPRPLANPNVNQQSLQQSTKEMLTQNTQNQPIKANSVETSVASKVNDTANKIPSPNEVKGVILAPENKTTETQETPK